MNANLIKRTLFYVLISGLVLMVLVPLSYLVTISFSNLVELSDFPKHVLPSFSEELMVEWDEEEGYYMVRRENPNGVVVDLYFSSDFERISTYFRDKLNVRVEPETIETDFTPARESGEVLEITYPKIIFNNYEKFFSVFPGADSALYNSIKAALYTILISLVFGGMIGYALARTPIKGKEAISLGSLIVRMFPIVSVSVPMAVLLIRYGMFDTMLGLAIVYAIPNIGLTAWITRSIFLGVNRELEEASLVFGATRAQTFRKITFPLVLPAFAASSMYAFITAWNDTAVSLLLTNENETLALLIYKSIGGSSSIHYSASGAIILILPALAFTFLLKNYINRIWG
ncbi:MAG: carbohydrate ABC transporter permease [Acholeplasmataceae bacterium]